MSIAALLIMLAGLMAYANSLKGPFIFDDHRSILDNSTIRQLWPLSTVLHTQRQTPVTGRPIANLSFAINFAIGGLNVVGYHVWNIAVHILTALTLFGVLRRTLVWAAPPTSGAKATDRVALVCTMAWMLHPLNTEAVDYVTQRTESMMGLFYLLTLYAAIRAWRAEGSWRWQWVAAIASACGMATKESMVTAPVIVVLCDRVFAFSSFRSAFKERIRLYLSLAAGWLLLGALSRQTPFFSSTGFDSHVSWWTYLINQPPIIARYLGLSIWPRRLVLDYGVPQPLTVADVWPSVTLVLTVMVLTFVALVRVPKLGFWGAWFFITLAPASSVFPIPSEVGAERRMYLPLVAVVVVIVLLGWLLVRRLTTLGARTSSIFPFEVVGRWVGSALVIAALIALAWATMQRNTEYRTALSIWQTAVERRPHARAHSNLAVQLRDVGQSGEAIKHLWIAAPELPDARHALGSALLERGDVREAIAQLQEFVRLKPNDREIVSAREELAAALLREGDADRATAQFRVITSIAPQYARGHLNLANMLLSSKDFAGAAAEYRECLRLQPNDTFALAHLGIALASSGSAEEAIAMFLGVLRIDPRDINTRRELVNVLLKQQRFAEAEAEARTLLSSHPDDAEAHNLFGVALASQRRLEDAIQQFADALRLNPQSREARDNLARAIDLRRRSSTPIR